MDTVALQMKNKAPLEDVSKLLTQIKDKLIKEQQDADALDAKRSKECKTEIA